MHLSGNICKNLSVHKGKNRNNTNGILRYTVVSIKKLAAVVPSLNGKWEVKEVPTPQPDPNQLLIKIYASVICYGDKTEALPAALKLRIGDSRLDDTGSYQIVGEVTNQGRAKSYICQSIWSIL